MPCFTIHLAIGKEYMKKHKIKDENEFQKGNIAPDFNDDFKTINKNKRNSHFTALKNGRQIIEIQEFKNSEKVDINKDFWKGYFLHILTDYYFYQKDFKDENQKAIKEKGSLYYDYDCLNKKLIEMYNIEPIENTKDYTDYGEGEAEYLNIDKIVNFIEKMSNLDIDYILEKMEY